jgi:pyruvate carboxylase
LGDIIKVTPSSKAVGDLALYLISRDMSVKELESLPSDHQLTFPNSVVDMFMGSLGQPEGGWPPKLQEIILRGRKPNEGRPGERLEPVDLEQAAVTMAEKTGSHTRTDLMSYLMYPDVFTSFAAARAQYGELDVLPTPQFFYGLQETNEVTVELEPGKALIIRHLTVGEPRPDGMRTVFFELNGQPREVEVRDKSLKEIADLRRKADQAKKGDVGAPMPGAVTMLHVTVGQPVKKGDRLLVMDAMKMQTTVYAPIDGTIKEIAVNPRDTVEARDLLVTIE